MANFSEIIKIPTPYIYEPSPNQFFDVGLFSGVILFVAILCMLRLVIEDQYLSNVIKRGIKSDEEYNQLFKDKLETIKIQNEEQFKLLQAIFTTVDTR